MGFHSWVMLGSLVGWLSSWHQWLGKHNSEIWNLVPGCLMWIVWLERNRRSVEDKEKTLEELRFYANAVYWSGLVIGVLLSVLLSLSLCLPLA